MLDEAAERMAPVVGEDHVFVSTNIAIGDAISSSGAFPADRVFAEPTRRNTLGAICWVCANLMAKGLGEASVAVVTADHIIGEPDLFRKTVTDAFDIAENEQGLVTLGIRPDRPETGYGYIEFDQNAPTGAGFRSKSFREKPGRETAEEFVRSGNFLWNSGMFFFTVPTFLRELEGAEPEARQATNRIAEALKAGDERAAVQAFEALPNLSVDYAVMEKAAQVYVVPAEFPWDDMGAWDALSRAFPSDEMGNVVRGSSVVLDTGDCVVVNEDPSATVGVIGISGIVVVNTKDAVLVCPKDRAQEVRRIVKELAER